MADDPIRIKTKLLIAAILTPLLLATLSSLLPGAIQGVHNVLPATKIWRGRYYQNSELKGSPALIRDDPAVTFQWGEEPPLTDWPKDHFSVRWTRFDLFEERVYVFAARSDDGIRMYVDGELIIEHWAPGSYDWTAVERKMTAGWHHIRIEYFEDTGPAFIEAGYYPLDH